MSGLGIIPIMNYASTKSYGKFPSLKHIVKNVKGRMKNLELIRNPIDENAKVVYSDLVRKSPIFCKMNQHFTSEWKKGIQEDMAKIPKVYVYKRELEERRKDIVRKRRLTNEMPTVVDGFGVGNSMELEKYSSDRTLLFVKYKDAERMDRVHKDALENTVFRLLCAKEEEEGDTSRLSCGATDVGLATINSSAFHPVTDQLETFGFVRLRAGRRVKIPLEIFNEEGSPGLKRGGYMNYIQRSILCSIFTINIPRTIEVDVTGCHVGHKIHISDLKLPYGIIPRFEENHVVATIAGKRSIAT